MTGNVLEYINVQVDSNQWDKLEGGEVVLRTWEVESAHNYDNNQHITQVVIHLIYDVMV